MSHLLVRACHGAGPCRCRRAGGRGRDRCMRWPEARGGAVRGAGRVLRATVVFRGGVVAGEETGMERGGDTWLGALRVCVAWLWQRNASASEQQLALTGS